MKADEVTSRNEVYYRDKWHKVEDVNIDHKKNLVWVSIGPGNYLRLRKNAEVVAR